MDIQKELEKAQEEMQKAKDNVTNEFAVSTNVAEQAQHNNKTMDLVDRTENALLNTDQVKAAASKVAYERVHAHFKGEAARINQKNQDTAETEFETETRKRRLERLQKEQDLQHKYNMSMIEQNGKHLQMLDKKKKMVEKYGYLYDSKQTTVAYDSEGKQYNVPIDFSYSETVNKFREFGRNISKLDRPILQTIKWILIGGLLIAGFFILKKMGIIN